MNPPSWQCEELILHSWGPSPRPHGTESQSWRQPKSDQHCSLGPAISRPSWKIQPPASSAVLQEFVFQLLQ
ncbi:hypothetical protein AV530_003233 [Patagioenas fasciata monilis]|uniref:Uncharacterized protein n=1 Tax=Patagioenas fasciata monilis TaxID=372326 RepID=A0A1V4KXN2_PATFA|nr:hypothetical protein AV530_003233 [Patagioenas fasciata monilis]